jgi:replicative DNA helicase
MASTGIGKSLIMCHMAAQNLLIGKNVLYITLELSQEKVAERIDANLLDISLDELKLLPKEFYLKKINRLKSKITGKLIVKEYPTACAGSANFRHLINELKLKKNFVPDIIYIDYLNICMSSRIKFSNNIQSYGYIKAIAEEIRGLAVEFDLPIVSATQTNRGGLNNSDPGLEDTSESMGLPMTADWYVVITTDEELDKLGQYMWKQLKSRYADINRHKKFVTGVNKAKMKLYEVENGNEGTEDDTPVMDNSQFFLKEEERSGPATFDKGRFQGFR